MNAPSSSRSTMFALIAVAFFAALAGRYLPDLTASRAQAAGGPPLPAEICFRIDDEFKGMPYTLTLRLAINDMGSGHILMNGRLTSSAEPGVVLPILGNAEVAQGRVLMTFAMARPNVDDQGGGGWFLSADLDASNLQGTADWFGVEYDPVKDMEDLDHGSGAMRRIACP